MTYKLARTLPDGTVKAWSTPFPTMRKAAQTVAYCLADNGLDTRAGATAFASRFQDAAPGTAVLHEASGYTFAVESATESILAGQVRGATWADNTRQPHCDHPDCIDPASPHISHGDH